MQHELTNLLPGDRLTAVKQDYFWRLGTLIIFILALLIVAHGLLLVPTYHYVSGEKARQEELLAQASEQLGLKEGKDITERLAALQSNAGQLIKLKSGSHISSIVEEVLSIPRAGITITSLSFAPILPRRDEVGHVQIRGTASTRDTLQNYKEALASVPGVTLVELPINAYAKERDIQFDISLTGSFGTP